MSCAGWSQSENVLHAELAPEEVNLAFNGTTWQISDYSDGYSDRANDGGYSPEFNDDSCNHCNNADRPWWAVDLGQSYRVSHVNVMNRNTASE